MNDILRGILETGNVTCADGTVIAVNSHINTEEGYFIQDVIRKLRPKVSLEIGMLHGVSSLFICDALSEVGASKHIVIDPHQNALNRDEYLTSDTSPGRPPSGMTNISRAGYSQMVRLIAEPSYQALPALVADGCRVDFAFIDGWHTFDYAFIDFFYSDKLLNVGGVIVFDDMFMPAVQKLCRYVETNRHYTRYMPEAWHIPRWRRGLLRVPKIGPRLGSEKNFAAYQKTADERPGDGTMGSTDWDFYRKF